MPSILPALLHHRERLRAWQPTTSDPHLTTAWSSSRRIVADRTTHQQPDDGRSQVYFPQVFRWFPDIALRWCCDFSCAGLSWMRSSGSWRVETLL
jgi:hypothetical protein